MNDIKFNLANSICQDIKRNNAIGFYSEITVIFQTPQSVPIANQNTSHDDTWPWNIYVT